MMAGIDVRASSLLDNHRRQVYHQTDRLFALLMIAQWIFGIVTTLIVSPRTWIGASGMVHIHVLAAIFLGGTLSSLPIYLALRHSGSPITRHVIAATQMLWSALLIHFTGGRIETHFHVFGSLAFLALYRDWKVLITATIVIATDHMVRGIYWPYSVYGVASAQEWRWLEHAGWVIFEVVVLTFSCLRGLREMEAIAVRQATVEAAKEITEEEVERRTSTLRQSEERFRAMTEASPIGVFITDNTGKCFYINSQCQSITGQDSAEAFGIGWLDAVHPDDRFRVIDHWREAMEGIGFTHSEHRVLLEEDRVAWVRVNTAPMHDGDAFLGIVGTIEDVTEMRIMETQLAHSQKLESIGQLASGIAHEINTPTQYVGDNLRFLSDAFVDCNRVMDTCRNLMEGSKERNYVPTDQLLAFESICKECDFEYLRTEIPVALEQAREGAERVADIVRAMKEFSHPGTFEKNPTDINRAIESTATVARNEYKYVADIEFDLDPNLPLVPCYCGELNQVFLNVIVNASQAIQEANKGSMGRIRVTTQVRDNSVDISISDDGIGIPPEIQPKVFDPFFTTKAVGKGTGQGLALSRNVIVNKHGGTLTFESEIGRGSTFTINLPLGAAAQECVA